MMKKFLCLSAIALTILSCSIEDEGCKTGKGSVIVQELQLENFNKIIFQTGHNLKIIQGDEFNVKLTGNPNIISDLNTSVKNNVWDIAVKNGCYQNYTLDIEIVMPEIIRLESFGDRETIVEDFVNIENLYISQFGSGEVNIGAMTDLEELKIVLNGSGAVKFLNPQILKRVDADVTGSGDIYGFNLESEDANVSILGSGTVSLTVKQNLKANIHGSGEILYRGHPEIQTTIEGSGKVVDSN